MTTLRAPAARRPIAALFRRTADRSVAFCVRHGVHPDAISIASVVVAAAGAACFALAGDRPGLLLPATGLIYLRLWLNMLDGMVALAAGKATRWGEVMNDLPDRVSDVLLFTGVALSGLAAPAHAYGAAIAAVLIAYVGVLGQAVGGARGFAGPMSKPWRMVVLHAGAWITLYDLRDGTPECLIGQAGMTWLDAACCIIVTGGIWTIARRLRILHAWTRRVSADVG